MRSSQVGMHGGVSYFVMVIVYVIVSAIVAGVTNSTSSVFISLVFVFVVARLTRPRDRPPWRRCPTVWVAHLLSTPVLRPPTPNHT